MRLIDADALFAEVKRWHDMFKGCTYIGDKARRDELGMFMAEIVNAPIIGGWISVKDKLPEEKINPLTQDFQKVICYCDFGGEPKRTDIRTYGFGTRTWESQPHFWDGQVVMDGVITHWMPLPEAPKEVSGNG